MKAKNIINSNEFEILDDETKKKYRPIYNYAGKIAGYGLFNLAEK